MIRVSFGALVLGEIVHKLAIVAEEPDLQESYDLTQAQAEALRDRWAAMRAGQPIELDAEEASIIASELGNSIEIAESNVECGADDWRPRLRALRAAKKLLESA